MNILLNVISRVYLLLTKVNNQSPLFGASIIVALLFGLFIRTIFLLFFFFLSSPLISNSTLDYSILIVIFLIILFIATRNKMRIIELAGMKDKTRSIIFTLIVIFVIVLLFIALANTNRNKLGILKKKNNSAVSLLDRSHVRPTVMFQTIT